MNVIRVAREVLYTNSIDLFGCEVDRQQSSLSLLEDHKREPIQSLHELVGNTLNPAVDCNFFCNYSAISYDHVRAHVKTFVGQQTSLAHLDYQVYQTIKKFVNAKDRVKIEVWDSMSTIDDQP